MDVLNFSERCLMIIGQGDVALADVMEASCFLPEPFYPNRVLWFVDFEDEGITTREVERARAYCAHSVDPSLAALSFEVRPCQGMAAHMSAIFRNAVVNPSHQLMVVCFQQDATALADVLPLFSTFARSSDRLMLASRKAASSVCTLQQVVIPASYFAITGDPFRLGDDELGSQQNRWLQPSPLIILPDEQQLLVDHQVIGLSPLLFAFYFWLARRRKQCQQHVLPNGGMVRYDQPDVAREFLSVYRHYCDDLSSHFEKAQFLLQEKFPKNYFLEKISLVRASFREVLGSRADQYLIHGIGKRNEMVHGLLLPPEFIRFER